MEKTDFLGVLGRNLWRANHRQTRRVYGARTRDVLVGGGEEERSEGEEERGGERRGEVRRGEERRGSFKVKTPGFTRNWVFYYAMYL